MEIQLDNLPHLFTILPYLAMGSVAVFLASALLLTSPLVFLPSTGLVSEDDFKHEHRKAVFVLIFTFSVIFIAAGWWAFTEAEITLSNLVAGLNEGL